MDDMTKRQILKNGTPVQSVRVKASKPPVPHNNEYDRHLPDWVVYLNAYEGGRNWTANAHYLFSHQREAAEDRAFRLKRAVYYNYARTIVDLFTSHLFRRDVARESDGPLYGRFLENADGRGASMNSFVRSRVAPMALALGMAYVVVDKPAATAEYSTLAEEIEDGNLPYCTLVLPQDVVNWREDRRGALEWIVIREAAPDSAGPLDDAPRTEWLYQAVAYAEGVKPELRITGPFDNLGRTLNFGWYALAGFGELRPEAMHKFFSASSVGENS